MTRTVAALIAALGVLVAAAGIVFQIAGATALVYCSVTGAGLLLVALGGVLWVIQAMRQGPTSHAA